MTKAQAQKLEAEWKAKGNTTRVLSDEEAIAKYGAGFIFIRSTQDKKSAETNPETKSGSNS